MQRCQFKPLRIIVHGFNLMMGLLGVLALGDRSAYAGFLPVGDHVITVRHADRERPPLSIFPCGRRNGATFLSLSIFMAGVATVRTSRSIR